jgi:hypothetical protein
VPRDWTRRKRCELSSTASSSWCKIAKALFQVIRKRIRGCATGDFYVGIDEKFRRMHRDAVTAAGAELVRFARSCGLIRGEWIAIDGSKFRAVASIDSARERIALQRYLDSIDKADEEQETNIDFSAVQAALEKLKQHLSCSRHVDHAGHVLQIEVYVMRPPPTAKTDRTAKLINSTLSSKIRNTTERHPRRLQFSLRQSWWSNH